jgi:hypothetical protein
MLSKRHAECSEKHWLHLPDCVATTRVQLQMARIHVGFAACQSEQRCNAIHTHFATCSHVRNLSEHFCSRRTSRRSLRQEVRTATFSRRHSSISTVIVSAPETLITQATCMSFHALYIEWEWQQYPHAVVNLWLAEDTSNFCLRVGRERFRDPNDFRYVRLLHNVPLLPHVPSYGSQTFLCVPLTCIHS